MLLFYFVSQSDPCLDIIHKISLGHGSSLKDEGVVPVTRTYQAQCQLLSQGQNMAFLMHLANIARWQVLKH